MSTPPDGCSYLNTSKLQELTNAHRHCTTRDHTQIKDTLHFKINNYTLRQKIYQLRVTAVLIMDSSRYSWFSN